MLKASLGVEPYEGKVLEDQNGPIDATRRDNTPFEPPAIPVPTPVEWVQQLVGRAMSLQDSLRYHHKTDSTVFVEQAAVLRRWLTNGEQALFVRNDADIVLDALQRSPADPVDPAETPPVRQARDAELVRVRGLVTARREQLIA